MFGSREKEIFHLNYLSDLQIIFLLIHEWCFYDSFSCVFSIFLKFDYKSACSFFVWFFVLNLEQL